MKLIELRVRNFRSIEAEQRLPIPGAMTLVGPNNSGKTNLLLAVQLLFTGQANNFGYSRDEHLTFEVGKNRTSITATFEGDLEVDKEVFEDVDDLHRLQGSERSGNQISLNLYFTETNTPVYSFFPNHKRPQRNNDRVQYSRTHISLLNKVLAKFKLHYVPSAKSIGQIYQELINPFLRKKVSAVIENQIPLIEDELNEAAGFLNQELVKAGLDGFHACFRLPGKSVEALVSGFDFNIADPHETPIYEKGMGIQTTALLAAFKWITEQERESGYEVIWLLEEPESYLHPHLAKNCCVLLDSLAEHAQVIKTTHSMAFVPQDPRFLRSTLLSKAGRTEVSEHKTYSEAISSIRSALGVRFGDFYNLAELNVFVEGPSDRVIFKRILANLPLLKYPLEYVRKAQFEDFGGVKHLSGFLRATYQFIRSERPCVAVFDGDDAGEKERRDLQAYFGQKGINFDSNMHFVSVRSRFSIEGLFPDEWLIKLHAADPGWFSSFSVDAEGALEPFSVKDDKKNLLHEHLLTLVDLETLLDDYEWAKRFVNFFSVVDKALRDQHGKISAN